MCISGGATAAIQAAVTEVELARTGLRDPSPPGMAECEARLERAITAIRSVSGVPAEPGAVFHGRQLKRALAGVTKLVNGAAAYYERRRHGLGVPAPEYGPEGFRSGRIPLTGRRVSVSG